MKRSVQDTASTLIGIYDENFASDQCTWYRIGWPELRSLAGVNNLSQNCIDEINSALRENSYTLVPCDSFIVFAAYGDFAQARVVPPRIIEEHLPDDDEVLGDDIDDDCDDD